jgi:hypothetical protein
MGFAGWWLSGAGNPARGLAFSQSSRLKAAAENHRAAQRNKDFVIQASACEPYGSQREAAEIDWASDNTKSDDSRTTSREQP